ncbi:MAG: DUF1439 domain-containing protein [Pseudomonadota bacterium]
MPKNRMHRTVWAIATIAVFIGGCAMFPLFTHEVAFTPQEITERLAKRFPVERNVADLVKVRLTRPRVLFLEPASANAARRLAVGVDLDVKLVLTNKSFFGQMTLSGVPRYDVAARAIFLQDAKLDRVRVDNMPDALSAALVKTASQIAKEFLEDKPIYAFDVADSKRLGPTVTLERIDLRINQLVLVLK